MTKVNITARGYEGLQITFLGTRGEIRERTRRYRRRTPIRTQLGWCKAEGVTRAIFTHCGSEIVGSDGRSIATWIRRLGRERGVDARVAHDGMRCDLAAGRPDRR